MGLTLVLEDLENGVDGFWLGERDGRLVSPAFSWEIKAFSSMRELDKWAKKVRLTGWYNIIALDGQEPVGGVEQEFLDGLPVHDCIEE